ncbi:MAG: hypothetical protein K5891_02900 [Lachnospiraceae bacterium]|nr:hypothetical protein [Lachnospiraceae bacterium]
MKEKLKGKIAYPLLGLLLFCILFAFFFRGFARQLSPGRETPDILLMGDSIFAYTRDETSVAALMNQSMDAVIADGSFGGTALCYRDVDARLGYMGDAFCMAALTQAMVTGDFRVQENARVRENATDYFGERLAALERIDLSGVKILVIEHQLNDYQGGSALEDPANPTGEYNYRGALRHIIGSLQEKYPDLDIVLASSPYVWYPLETSAQTGADRDFGYGTLDDFADVQAQVAEETGCGLISLRDVYPEAESSEDPEIWRVYTVDGMHPNAEGRRLIAEALTEALWNRLREKQ